MANKNSQIIKKEEGSAPVISQEEYEIAKSVAAKGSTDAEFRLLVHIANKYKLDPLLKEIWLIKRTQNEPAIIMTSRDGYLSIAHRSGKLDGLQSGTVENEKGELIKAWCEVWRKDMSHSFKAEVKYSEYRQNSFIWQKYPSAMLIKVAEVFALKRAFSISGMLTQEEMGEEYQRAENKEQITKDSQTTPFSDGSIDYLKGEILKLGKELGLDEEKTKDTVEAKFKLKDFEELNPEQAKETVQALEKKLKKK
jgi:phage recombination protein Bet